MFQVLLSGCVDPSKQPQVAVSKVLEAHSSHMCGPFAAEKRSEII